MHERNKTIRFVPACCRLVRITSITVCIHGTHEDHESFLANTRGDGRKNAVRQDVINRARYLLELQKKTVYFYYEPSPVFVRLLLLYSAVVHILCMFYCSASRWVIHLSVNTRTEY